MSGTETTLADELAHARRQLEALRACHRHALDTIGEALGIEEPLTDDIVGGIEALRQELIELKRAHQRALTEREELRSALGIHVAESHQTALAEAGRAAADAATTRRIRDHLLQVTPRIALDKPEAPVEWIVTRGSRFGGEWSHDLAEAVARAAVEEVRP